MTEPNATNSDGYRLGRGYRDASRLNMQHFMWKDTQEYLLHPVIQASLHLKREGEQNGTEDSVRVADLATGTAVWLFDLIKSPEVSGLDIQFHGSDISKALFPHSSWLPKNIVLSISNLLEEPPQSLHGQFDVVHLRLVLSLVRNGNPRPIIQHTKMLLKPGGYLQWDERDLINHYDVLTPNPDANAQDMKAAFQGVKDLTDWSWVSKLPQTLLEEGFQNAVQYSHEPRPEMFKSWAYLDLCLAEELSFHWYGSEDEYGKKWREHLPKAYDEADESNGAVLRPRTTVTIARKPL